MVLLMPTASQPLSILGLARALPAVAKSVTTRDVSPI
jgi:hypothetical protein